MIKIFVENLWKANSMHGCWPYRNIQLIRAELFSTRRNMRADVDGDISAQPELWSRSVGVWFVFLNLGLRIQLVWEENKKDK